MARRRVSKQHEARQARERVDRAAAGYVFAVVYWIDALRYGPIYFHTMEEAVERRDQILRENECEIPMEYYDRQAHLLKLAIEIEAFARGSWATIGGSIREIVFGVDFVDGARERVRRRG